MAITYMTKEGYKKKMEEIAYLESVKRPEISRAIAEARDKGDLSENAEYDAAKEAQGMLEMKISQLKDLVANARILDESQLNCEEVQILNRVTIKNVANGMTMEYTIVADSEANLKEKKIASSTPIARPSGTQVGRCRRNTRTLRPDEIRNHQHLILNTHRDRVQATAQRHVIRHKRPIRQRTHKDKQHITRQQSWQQYFHV